MSDVSIVVAPRERFSSVLRTLDELLDTTHDDIPIVIVEGGSPDWIRRELEKKAHIPRVHWIKLAYLPVPNHARNIGATHTNSTFIAFVDNDMTFESGWLEALVNRAESDAADVVAPTICIGPPRATVVHHAGGDLYGETVDDEWRLKERHRMMDVPISEMLEAGLPVETDVAEFHCVLIRRSFLMKMGALDERLVTREQMDLALQCKDLGARVVHEKSSVVTYFARDKFRRDDLSYHLFRWSHALAERSLDTFEKKWQVDLDRQRILASWIGNHRRRAISSAFPILKKLIPGALFRRFVAALEARSAAEIARVSLELQSGRTPSTTARKLIENPH